MDLFSFDLDGTLLPDPWGEVPFEMIKKINELVEKGHIILFNSGRPLISLLDHLKDVSKSDNVYFATNNGSALFKQDGSPIFYEEVPGSMLKKLQLEHPELTIFSYTLKDVLVAFKYDKYVESEVRINKMPYELISFDQDISNHILLKYVICQEVEILNKTKYEFDTSKFELFRTNPKMDEIILKGFDKNDAIIRLKSIINNIECVYVFGDSNNDITSLENHYGITFKNGKDECKKVAKYIAKKECYEGVIEALEKLGY